MCSQLEQYAIVALSNYGKSQEKHHKLENQSFEKKQYKKGKYNKNSFTVF